MASGSPSVAASRHDKGATGWVAPLGGFLLPGLAAAEEAVVEHVVDGGEGAGDGSAGAELADLLDAVEGEPARAAAPQVLLNLPHSSLTCEACRAGPTYQVRFVPFADMPTVAREGPYRIFFYSNEGAEPMHVHVERDERVAKYWLTPVRLVKNGGFKRHELSDIENLVNRHKAVAEQKWVAHFGASQEGP